MIVSHSNASILELCDDVLWIHDGLVKEYGPAAEVVENYEGLHAPLPQTARKRRQTK